MPIDLDAIQALCDEATEIDRRLELPIDEGFDKADVQKAIDIYKKIRIAMPEALAEMDRLREIEMATLGWDGINDERVGLIKKEIREGLTDAEEKRLAKLQRVADLRIEVVAPITAVDLNDV